MKTRKSVLFAIVSSFLVVLLSGCYITELQAQELTCGVDVTWTKPERTKGTDCGNTTGYVLPSNANLGYKVGWTESGSTSWTETQGPTSTNTTVTHRVTGLPCLKNLNLRVGGYYANDVTGTVACWSEPATVFIYPSDPPGSPVLIPLSGN